MSDYLALVSGIPLPGQCIPEHTPKGKDTEGNELVIRIIQQMLSTSFRKSCASPLPQQSYTSPDVTEARKNVYYKAHF